MNDNNSLTITKNNTDEQLSILINIDWFYGILSRKEAEKKLLCDGEFLLRLSRSKENSFTVSTKWNGKYLHVVIKQEIKSNTNEVTYYMVPKYKFSTLTELINFHVTKHHPLPSSDALLCKAVGSKDTARKEHKFKKGVRGITKPQLKNMPRSGSTTILRPDRRMSTFSEMNKSLDELSTSVLDEPTKSSKRGLHSFANKLFPSSHRSSKVSVRKGKCDKGGRGASIDCCQAHDSCTDQMRRGVSMDAITSILNGFNYDITKSVIEDVSVASHSYVSTRNGKNEEERSLSTKEASSAIVAYKSDSDSDSVLGSRDHTGDCAREVIASTDPEGILTNGGHHLNEETFSPINNHSDRNGSKHSLGRNSSSIYVLPSTNIKPSHANANLPQIKDTSAFSILPNITDTTANSSSIKRNESVYVIPLTPKNTAPTVAGNLSSVPSHDPQSSITIRPFLHLQLSDVRLNNCAAISGVIVFLLSRPDRPLALCIHLIAEIRRIFFVASASGTLSSAGYRCLFLPNSSQCQRDLAIRQRTLTSFVMTTIATAQSIDQRIDLIMFWTKCADILLHRVRDMFHFRSVVSALLSDQIVRMNAWETVYRLDPALILTVQSLRDAIRDGCFMQTGIDRCVPDLVQLYSTFICDGDADVTTTTAAAFNEFCDLCLDIIDWSSQCFEDASTWLIKVHKDHDSVATVPLLAELVQTETLLSLLIGRCDINVNEVSHELSKVDESVGAMVSNW